MSPTEILKAEHRVIEQVLDCLVQIAANAGRQGRLEQEPAREAIDFFRNFADRCHHAKEEAHLFPAMEAKGFSREHGPTGVMLYEHQQGRDYLGNMESSIPAAATGDPVAVERFCDQAEGYIGLLREHIGKEDHCLFSMADNVLTPEEQKPVVAGFEQVERNQAGGDTHQKCLNIAAQLAGKYAAAGSHAAIVEHGCGHHADS